MSGAIGAGGHKAGVSVVIQGWVVEQVPLCGSIVCLPISWVSPDINGDLAVNLVDLSLFGPVFLAGAAGYDPAMDFNCDGVVNLVDLALMSAHWQHIC